MLQVYVCPDVAVRWWLTVGKRQFAGGS